MTEVRASAAVTGVDTRMRRGRAPGTPTVELNMARQIQTVRPGSLKYAAARIGVSLPILYALIKAGKLRSYHIGRAHRVSEQSIADCIALLEGENQDRPASSPRRRLLGVDSANEGSLRTALNSVASDKCA